MSKRELNDNPESIDKKQKLDETRVSDDNDQVSDKLSENQNQNTQTNPQLEQTSSAQISNVPGTQTNQSTESNQSTQTSSAQSQSTPTPAATSSAPHLTSGNSALSLLPASVSSSVTVPPHFQPTAAPSDNKPSHGSAEWHRLRKENHKEVERRRRENINIGIRELANLIPTSDTNKSQILQRAVEYIKRLKENETNNIEKWTLEKLLTEQAVSELDASNTKLKQELERAYREIEQLKRALMEKK